MAVKSKEELLGSIKTIIGDTPSDEALSLLEDISDTLDSSTGGSSDEDKKKIEELEKRVKETDDMWRKRYTERFFNPKEKDSEDDETEDEEDDETETPKSFEDLFTETEK